MQITLPLETVNQIISVLAQLPNQSGTYPLMQEIRETAEQQYKAAQIQTKVQNKEAQDGNTEL